MAILRTQLLQNDIEVLIHFIQGPGIDSLNLLDFLDLSIVMVRSGMQRSKSFIHHVHGGGTSFSHGDAGTRGFDTKCQEWNRWIWVSLANLRSTGPPMEKRKMTEKGNIEGNRENRSKFRNNFLIPYFLYRLPFIPLTNALHYTPESGTTLTSLYSNQPNILTNL